MSKYSDDFFIEYEDIYSDSKQRDSQRRSSERRVNNQQRNNSGYDRRDSRSGYSQSRDPQRSRSGSQYQRSVRPQNVYRQNDDGRGRSGYRNSYDDRGRNSYRGSYDDRGSQRGSDRREPDRRSSSGMQKLPRRTRRIAIIAIILVILVVLTSGIVGIAKAFSGVEEVKSLVTSDVGANQVVLSWNKVKKADGYRIMMAKNGSDFTEYQTIDDPDTVTATVSDLDQASEYNFSVITLFKGKESDPVKLEHIKTLPAAPEITNIFSADPGTIHVDWSQNDSADGYLVEYKKDGSDYSADMTQTISDKTICKTDITDLELNETYQVRVIAFISATDLIKSAPSSEESVKVVAEKVDVLPKAKDQNVDGALDPEKPMIALTFDDGPSVNNDASDRILDVLEKNHAKATFFMVGYYVSENPGNVKRKADLKMELGNHTWDHTHYGDQVTPDDIRRASNQVYEATGQYTTCFRSPGGMTTQSILNECAAENMAAYYWSIDTQDWSSRNADSVYSSVMDHVKDGDIILMHEIYDSTADAVERMVPELIAQGYQLVTCHDLIKLKGGAEPEPGKQYVNAFTQSQ